MKRALLVFAILAILGTAAFIGASVYSSIRPLPIAQPMLGKGIYRLYGLNLISGGLLWSPDGKWLAGHITEMPMPDMCFGCNPHSEIFVVDTLTWTRRTVLWFRVPGVGSLSWFPDSKHLAYNADSMGGDNANAIRSIRIDGQEDAVWSGYDSVPDRTDNGTRLAYNAVPIWSPDGSRLALGERTQKNQNWYPTIELIDANQDNGNVIFTGEASSYVSQPSWSPDARHLAFAFGLNVPDPSPRASIYIADIGTGNLTRLTQDGQDYLWAQYAPKGTLIVLARAKAAYSYVAVLRDLTSACEVSLPVEDVRSASWSPDAHRLVIYADLSAYIVNLDQFLGPKFAATGSLCP